MRQDSLDISISVGIGNVSGHIVEAERKVCAVAGPNVLLGRHQVPEVVAAAPAQVRPGLGVLAQVHPNVRLGIESKSSLTM